jgi:hypothetical protein
VDIKPGQATLLTATPLDAGGAKTSLPTGDVPRWTVSDPTKVTASPSVDGLTLAVTVILTATPGDIVFDVIDGVITTAVGTITLTIPAPVVNAVASFSVSASTPV